MKHKVSHSIINVGIICMAISAALFLVYGFFVKQSNEDMVLEEEPKLMGDVSALDDENSNDAQADINVDLSQIYVMIGNNETIKLFYAENENTCYFFLPSYAQMKKTDFFFLEPEYSLTIDDKEIKSGMNLMDFQLDTVYPLTITIDTPEIGEVSKECNIRFMISKNIPALFLGTRSGNMDYIHASQDNKEPGSMHLLTATGEEDYSGELEKVKGRGNYSWMFEKKPYKIALPVEQSLLGMDSSKEWVLLANATDGSYMRNMLVFDLAREVGMDYSPEAVFIDLYCNGEYRGLYYLCESVESSMHEVMDQDMQDDEQQAFIIEKDSYMDSEYYFSTGDEGIWTIHYPEIVAKETMSDLQSLFQTAQNAIFSEDGIDSVTGKYYTELVDLDGMVKKYLIDEITKCIDGWNSNYFYSHGDGKIYGGSVWDFDMTLGNVHDGWYQGAENPQGVILTKYSQWYAALNEKDDFHRELVDEYNELFLPAIEKIVNQNIDQYSSKIQKSVLMDNARWDFAGNWMPYRDFEQQTKALKNYIVRRSEYLDEVWNQKEIYHEVMLKSDGDVLTYYYVKDGQTLENILEPTSENRQFLYWCYDNYQKYSPYYPVYEDVTLTAVWSEAETMETKMSINTTDGGGKAMLIISFILLLVPGLVTLLIIGLNNCKTIKENVLNIIICLGNDFFILILVYGVFNYASDGNTLSFSDMAVDTYYSIYNINVVFKYGALALAVACLLGISERVLWKMVLPKLKSKYK